MVTESIFKLLNIFGNLVQRNLIALELSDKMPLLVVKLNAEMDDARKIFVKQQTKIKESGRPRTERNMPLVAGQLKFAQEVKTKITFSMKAFKSLAHPICYSPNAELVFQKYKDLSKLLAAYEEDVYTSWVTQAEKKTLEGLDRPLLERNVKDGTLKVNFGRDTLASLSEVKHLKKEFPARTVPKSAAVIFTRFEDFRAYNNCLDKIVDLYNYLKTDTIDKEYRLFEAEVVVIDKLLSPAETTMTWNGTDIYMYIENCLDAVSELNQRVRQSQDNIIEIYKQASQWEEVALFVREEDGQQLLNLRDREENKKARYAAVTKAAVRIHELVRENEKLFEVELDDANSLKNWGVYLKHIDNIVADSLLQTVAVSLGYILDETDVNQKPRPLFATRLELSQPDIVFQPSLDRDIVNNFLDQAISLVDEVMGMGALVPRISIQKNAGLDYMETVKKHPELRRLRDDYITRLEKVIKKAKEQRDSFLDYSYLWTESRQENLFYFLKYSRQLSGKELEMLEEDVNAVKKKTPELEDFKVQIELYESLHEEVKRMPNENTFQSWFHVDISPFKTTLLTNIKRWSYVFKKNRLDHVVESLSELDHFVEKADMGLLSQVHEGDYTGLVKVMEVLKSVKERQKDTDDMFEPLEEVINLLKKYGVEIPEVTKVQLRELPEKWANTKRLAVTSKQIVAPLMGMEIGKLKLRIENYERQQRDFRNKYTQMRFFSYQCKSPYEQLSKANIELEGLEVQVKELQSQAALFEVMVPDFPLIKQCRRENKMLKQLWDYIFLVRYVPSRIYMDDIVSSDLHG